MTTTETVTITEPGVYDLTDEVYHGDPVPGGSLSSTGARKLLNCPAKYHYERLNGQPTKAEFEFGKAAHRMVLGAGPELVVLVGYDDWKSATARAQRDELAAEGKIGLLQKQFDVVSSMAEKLREHPTASKLLSGGKAEQSFFWVHEPTGVWCRARLDYLRDPVPGQRLLVGDYKTTNDAHPDAVQRSIFDWGYHIQGAWELDAVQALGLAPDGAAFLLVCQEKTPPYVVSVVEPAQSSLAWGARDCERARQLYREYNDAGHWPGYTEAGLRPGDPFLRELPRYAEQRYEEALARGDYDTIRGM